MSGHPPVPEWHKMFVKRAGATESLNKNFKLITPSLGDIRNPSEIQLRQAVFRQLKMNNHSVVY
jgi:hypothetical protein